MRVNEYEDGHLIIRFESGETAVREQALVLLEALAIYAERNTTRKDNWRKQGWRGPLYDLRDKVERTWDLLWDAEPPDTDYTRWCAKVLDEVLDSINYAGILVRAVREGDRDGHWFR